MKKYFILAAAAFAFAACTSDVIVPQEQVQQAVDDGAVSFDAYLQRATTRAGYSEDDMKLTSLQTQGFGVFAYYTDNRDYDQLAIPNFMYNTKVTFSSYWSYAPVMYWPNEYGNSAISDDADKVSFFAYAPYVNVTPSTGKPLVESSVQSAYEFARTAYESARTAYETAKVTYESAANRSAAEAEWTTAKSDWATAKTTWATAQETYYKNGGGEFGITEMTRNTTAGDPIVKYIGSFKKAESVDLCWGVCQQADWQIVEGGKAQKFNLGTPWLDVQRPANAEALGASTGQKLKFQFKHALAKMQITIDEFNDAYTLNGAIDGNSRIWIRSVRFTGFTMKGALNLNNELPNEPYWMNYNGIGDLVADNDLTVYDGRKDGKEGMAGATATNEKVLGLNEKFVEDNTCFDYKASSGTAWADVPTGVDAVTTPLFEGGGIFYVIPTGDDMQIEIVYDVETIDPKLGTYLSDGKTPGSAIENRIYKNIVFGSDVTKLEAGKAYAINLHLGMNSVKFDADVVDWDAMAAPDVDLPANMPQYAAGAADQKMEIPGANTETVFAITGLKGGEAIGITSGFTYSTGDNAANIYVNSTSAFPGTAAACDKRANASGVVYVKVKNITPNATIKDKNAVDIEVTGALSGATTIKAVQKAQKLALASASVSGAVWTLASSTNATWSNLVDGVSVPTLNSDNGIKVWCDGALLTVKTGSAPANESEVQLDWSAGTLTFNSARTSGQIVKIYLKAGDVPAETITLDYNGAKLP